MVYGGETWVRAKEEDGVLLRSEMVIVRLMYGVKLRSSKGTSEMILIWC